MRKDVRGNNKTEVRRGKKRNLKEEVEKECTHSGVRTYLLCGH